VLDDSVEPADDQPSDGWPLEIIRFLGDGFPANGEGRKTHIPEDKLESRIIELVRRIDHQAFLALGDKRVDRNSAGKHATRSASPSTNSNQDT
jgi:hypothetical protein